MNTLWAGGAAYVDAAGALAAAVAGGLVDADGAVAAVVADLAAAGASRDEIETWLTGLSDVGQGVGETSDGVLGAVDVGGGGEAWQEVNALSPGTSEWGDVAPSYSGTVNLYTDQRMRFAGGSTASNYIAWAGVCSVIWPDSSGGQGGVNEGGRASFIAAWNDSVGSLRTARIGPGVTASFTPPYPAYLLLDDHNTTPAATLVTPAGSTPVLTPGGAAPLSAIPRTSEFWCEYRWTFLDDAVTVEVFHPDGTLICSGTSTGNTWTSGSSNAQYRGFGIRGDVRGPGDWYISAGTTSFRARSAS